MLYCATNFWLEIGVGKGNTFFFKTKKNSLPNFSYEFMIIVEHRFFVFIVRRFNVGILIRILLWRNPKTLDFLTVDRFQ